MSEWCTSECPVCKEVFALLICPVGTRDARELLVKKAIDLLSPDPIHDESLAIEQLRALPRDARLHLAHVFRNGLCLIMAAIDRENRAKAREQALKLEGKLREMGL